MVGVSAKILVVDDEEAVRKMVARVLKQHGYRVLKAGSGREALLLDQSEEPDLILLDVMLPDIDGSEVLRRLRARTTTPIVMLTVLDGEADRVAGLDGGADAYVGKPFTPRALLARVRALLRRSQEYGGPASAGDSMDFGEVNVDFARREVVVKGQRKSLTPKEADLLHQLASNAGHVVPRDLLLQRVWGYEGTVRTRTLDVHIQRLRAKLQEAGASPTLIMTVSGIGYKLQVTSDPATGAAPSGSGTPPGA
ncbi:MAG: response regulator transcription factor [Armatimonadota bacterium]